MAASNVLSERSAAAVASTPATARRLRSRMKRWRKRRARSPAHRLLRPAQRLGRTQNLHSMIPTLTDRRSRCSSVHEKNAHPTYDASASNLPNSKPTTNTAHFNAPRPHCNTLLSSRVGAHKDLKLAPLTRGSKRDRWDDRDTEAADKRGGSDVDGDKKTTPLMRSTKKRCLSAVGEEPLSKRRIKSRRFSSPFSSDEETKTGDESDISSYAPSKPHHALVPRPTPSRSTGLEGDTSDDGPMGLAGGRSDRRPPSRMAVVYQQQSWEGKIVDERDAKQGRGRPRKQYLVRWKPSWVDGGRLTAPELLQNWRETKVLSKRSC